MGKKDKPLYMQIYDDLKTKIDNNEYAPHEKIPTEKELADLFEVSKITSKRALVELEKEGLIYRKRGSGSFVLPEVEDKISPEKKVVSLVLPFESNGGGIMKTIRSAAVFLQEQDYYLSVHSTEGTRDEEREMLQKLYEDNVSGVILYPNSERMNLDLIYYLYIKKFPLVTIDKFYEGLPISYVVSENFCGGFQAAECLIQKGHSKIGYISTRRIENVVSVKERFFGYLSALDKHNININQPAFSFDLKKDSEIKSTLKQLKENRFTAIFAENDQVALRIIDCCQQLGIKIPEELSVIGFDDIDAAGQASLSTVAQNFDKMGENAAEIIVDSLENHKYQYEKVKLPVNIIERETVKDIKKQKTAKNDK